MDLGKMVLELKKDANGDLLPFTANGKKYIPISPGSPIPVRIWKEYEKMQIVLGSGVTFAQMMDALHNIERILASDKPFADIRLESILAVNSLRRNVVEVGNERYNKAFYMASLFIRQEGVSEWSMEIAEQSINDWEKANVSAQDLFFFALKLVIGFKERYQKITEALAQESDTLAGTISKPKSMDL